MDKTMGLRGWRGLRPAKSRRITSRFADVLPLSVVCIVAVLPTSLFAQQAVQQTQLESSHISLTLYFPSAAAEIASRAQLHGRVQSVAKQLSEAPDDSLISALDRTEALLSELQTHVAFFKVLTLEDTQNQAAKIARDEVATDSSVLRGAMTARLRQLSPEAEKSLGPYTYLAHTARMDAAHSLSPDALNYRGAVVRPAEQGLNDAYERLIASLPRNKDVVSPILDLRRTALAQRGSVYDLAAPEAATLLAEIVELENRDASAMGYRNAADRKYQDLGLDEQTVDRTLVSVHAEAPIYRQYQQVLADHAASALGVSPVLSSEVDLVTKRPPPIPVAQARTMILAALEPLGKDYTKRMGDLLNPQNGRLDLAGGAHRAQTGTSIDATLAPAALYYGGYDGSLQDVSIIAHEGGHTIHRELMNASGIPLYAKSGPHYLFEGFAICNELLVLDYAARTAVTPQEKQYALERLLAELSLELFVSAEETALERNLYTAASGKALLDRAQVDTIYRDSIEPYEYWPVTDVGQSRGWMRKSLLFEDPLYLVNYLYASVVAVALYDKAHSDPEFAAKYEALLRGGFTGESKDLLASIGIRLDDPNLVKPAVRLLQQKTAELKQLYSDSKLQ